MTPLARLSGKDLIDLPQKHIGASEKLTSRQVTNAILFSKVTNAYSEKKSLMALYFNLFGNLKATVDVNHVSDHIIIDSRLGQMLAVQASRENLVCLSDHLFGTNNYNSIHLGLYNTTFIKQDLQRILYEFAAVENVDRVVYEILLPAAHLYIERFETEDIVCVAAEKFPLAEAALEALISN